MVRPQSVKNIVFIFLLTTAMALLAACSKSNCGAGAKSPDLAASGMIEGLSSEDVSVICRFVREGSDPLAVAHDFAPLTSKINQAGGPSKVEVREDKARRAGADHLYKIYGNSRLLGEFVVGEDRGKFLVSTSFPGQPS